MMKVALLPGFLYSGGEEKLVLEEMRGLDALGDALEWYAPCGGRKACSADIPQMDSIHPLLPCTGSLSVGSSQEIWSSAAAAASCHGNAWGERLYLPQCFPYPSLLARPTAGIKGFLALVRGKVGP
jgi:hypothetical protein